MVDGLKFTPIEKESVVAILDQLSQQSHYPMELEDLIDRWRRFVIEVERGYEDSIYEYANDLAARDAIHEILRHAAPSLGRKLGDALLPLDERYILATKEITVPVLGTTMSGAKPWWFRIPKNPSSELAEDLRSDGIIS